MAKQKKARTKRELDRLRDYAFRMFMGGETQKYIAKWTDVSEVTVSKWGKDERWEEKRREQNSSNMALVNSLMTAARRLSELIVKKLNNGEEEDIPAITKLSDNIAKIIASAKRIAKGITKEDALDVLLDLEQWLMLQMETDDELTPEIIVLINKYHKKYLEYISLQEA